MALRTGGQVPAEEYVPDVSATAAVFALVDPAWVADLVPRVRDRVLRSLAADAHLPRALTDHVLAGDDAAALAALARNRHLPEAVRLALASLGRPELSVDLYAANQHAVPQATLLAVRAAVLAAADPADPRWYAPDGLVPMLSNTWADHRLVPQLRGPFPELIMHAVQALALDLPPAVLLDACRRLLEAGGDEVFDAFIKDAETQSDLRHRGVAGRWREAVAAEPALDDAAFAAQTLLLGLRHLGEKPPRDERYADDTDEPWNLDFAGHALRTFPSSVPDWSLVRSEHERLPFTGPGLAALTAHPDCPGELVAAAYRENPNGVFHHASSRVPLEWVVAAGPEHATMPSWAAVVAGGLTEGRYEPADVLAELTPAHRVFAVLPLDVPAVRQAVAGLAARLGTDLAAWTALLRHQVWYVGTARQLVSSALAGRVPETPFPQPKVAVGPGQKHPVEEVFRILFSCADRDAQNALLPRLPERAREILLAPGAVDDELWSRVAAIGIPGELPAPPCVHDGPAPGPAAPTPVDVVALAAADGSAMGTVGEILRHASRPGFARDPGARALIRHVRSRLDRPDAWVVALRLLPDFPGSLAELLDVAAATAGPVGGSARHS